MIDCESIAQYFSIYIKDYHKEFERFITPPPEGAGYPNLICSPYLYANEFNIYIARDGLIVLVYEKSIPDDFKKKGSFLKNANMPSDYHVFSGTLPIPVNKFDCSTDNGIKLNICKFSLSLKKLTQIITLGIDPRIIRLKDMESDLWIPMIIYNLGFLSPDDIFKRDSVYIEIYPHIDKSAWDKRSIWAKVRLDIKRDFLRTIFMENKEGGTLELNNKHDSENVDIRLTIFAQAIIDFEELLNKKINENESVFHNFLKENPFLLDFYGVPISKPKFYYPEGESPLGKEYVEPDFIIKYPGNKYKLVELERPSKPLETVKGHPRSEVTQSAFQISEWEDYIEKHYNLIKDRFPSIVGNNSGMVIIGRSTKENIKLLNKQYTAEILTYDNLLDKAKQAYIQLINLK